VGRQNDDRSQVASMLLRSLPHHSYRGASAMRIRVAKRAGRLVAAAASKVPIRITAPVAHAQE